MTSSSRYDVVAPASVYRVLDELSDEDYDLVAAAMMALADNPFPAGAVKLRVPNARLRLVDGTGLSGPFLRIRCRSAMGGKSGGFRIIYVVDTKQRRVCIARIARRDDETYNALDQALGAGRLSPFGDNENRD